MADKPSILEQLHPNPKLEKLRKEEVRLRTKAEKAEGKMHQSEHKVTLEENRIETKEKESRAARTHRLCTRAGHIEFLIPETKELTDNQFMAFCDALFSYPKMKELVSKLLAKVKEEN